MRTPPRNPRPYDGQLTCHADPPCPNPATWHIAWLLAPYGHFSLACDEHLIGLESTYDYVDRHPADIMCTMPGTGWATGTEPSHCVIAPTTQPGTRDAS